MTDESLIETQQIPANKLKAAWQLLKLTFVEWMNDNTIRVRRCACVLHDILDRAHAADRCGRGQFLSCARNGDDRIVGEMQNLVGAQGAQAVRQVIESSRGFGKGIWAVSVGIVMVIMGATAVFGELQSALNHIWDVKSKPDRSVIGSLIVDRLRSFSIALCVGFLLLVSLVISAVISALQDYMNNWLPGLPWVWQTANAVASFVVIAILFAMIYKFLPDVVISWKDVWIGAAVTAVLFTGGKYLIGIYLGHTATASAFGAAGSLVVLLFWIYYSALIMFLGAEFTQVYARRYGSKIRPQRHAVRVGRKDDSI